MYHDYKDILNIYWKISFYKKKSNMTFLTLFSIYSSNILDFWSNILVFWSKIHTNYASLFIKLLLISFDYVVEKINFTKKMSNISFNFICDWLVQHSPGLLKNFPRLYVNKARSGILDFFVKWNFSIND